MEYITEIYNAIIGSTLYTIIAIAFIILIGYGIGKKLFKLVLITVVCLLGYLGYIAIAEGPEAAKKQGENIADEILDTYHNITGQEPDENALPDWTGPKPE